MIRKLFLLALAVSSFGISNSQIVQKVVIEDFTGAWCGYCPDGGLVMASILSTKPNTIGVAIHNSDQMVTANGNTIDAFYNGSSYPAGTINQSGAAISRNLWSSATTTALNALPEAGVSFGAVTYNSTTRVLTAVVKSHFGFTGSGVYRMNLFVIEDSVSGTGSGYDQANYYSTTSGHPLFGLGNPIVGYQHNHVLRFALSAWGQAGSVPNVTAGSDNSFTFTTTLGAGWDVSQIYLIGILNKVDGGSVTQHKIVNAEEVKLSDALIVSNTPERELADVTVSPNPFSEKVTLSFNLDETTELNAQVLDMTGKLVQTIASGTMNNGLHTVNWDGKNGSDEFVANGIYFIRIATSNGKAFTSRVSFQR